MIITAIFKYFIISNELSDLKARNIQVVVFLLCDCVDS